MIVGHSPAAKRNRFTTDWSHSSGAVVKEGRYVPPRARKTFTAEVLLTTDADWEALRTEVQAAAAARPERLDRLTECVPMLMRYKRNFEQRARDTFGPCIFSTAAKTRAWSLKNPNTITRYVPGHGYFLRVLSKITRYIMSTDNTELLSWNGFRAWLLVPEPGRKPEHHFPPGTLLARTGQCYVSVAVVCYVPPDADEATRERVKAAIANECDLLDLGDPNNNAVVGEGEGSVVEFTRAFDDYDDDDDDDGGGGDDEGNDDGDDRLTTCATLSQVAASLAPSDDEDVHAGSDDECPINVSVLAQKISDEKATVQEEERRVAIRKSNLLLWEDQMREHTATATRRKRAREEEIEGMLDETLVDRQVIASYIKDVGEYADPNGSLTEHFKSSKREERVFSHSRGLQHLRGEGFGLGVSRFVRAQVSHSYIGVSSEHKVVVVCEVRDVPSYFNVGVTQLQLKRAATSLDGFGGYAKVYHAAYTQSPPANDTLEHTALGHSVYSLQMTVEEKKAFFEPLKCALAATAV